MDTVLLLILLVSEMLKIPGTKVEAYFLKKHAFVTKVMCAKFVISRIFYKAILVSEPYWFPRCIAHMSNPKKNLDDAIINAKKINVTFS